ncbi:MAG: Fumarylacetoacetate hydrolase family protein [uncultured Acidimicrobiales bacterium]|uniref:Fumarylacetoacetate hydrolase family protein n=1 Tax=uncultured Acidimicrobiales bacterium TaxID=310071 RepID=A0A6J4ID66_9ACTN|nr:MAG: Fumarylacetoacetate hydrolase family protein [uncultured Acidimicrobiales bacterium]
MAIRMAVRGGRAHLVVGDRLVDIERASGGTLPADPMEALARWDDLRAWGDGAGAAGEGEPYDVRELDVCVPRPRKVFGIALNYRMHAEETGAQLPPSPAVFTKFPSCLSAPTADVVLPSEFVDWEVELVVVIGRGGSRIDESGAADHIAGYCVGQDYSERRVQNAGARPQFSLGKSYDTFGPIGPAVVSLDAFADPDDLGLTCVINGETKQDGRTNDLIFGVPELVSRLSDVCTLEPGDLIFTGTPSGVGQARKPPEFLRAGDVVESAIEGIGTLRNTAVERR